jgi:hypothetical protein
MKRLPLILSIAATCLVFSCSESEQTGQGEKKGTGIPAIMRPTLSFYHIPKCFLCAEISGALGEMEKEHRSRMNFRTVDYHLPTSQETIRRFLLGSHGIVISDAEGNELWSMAAHHQGIDELKAAVARLING